MSGVLAWLAGIVGETAIAKMTEDGIDQVKLFGHAKTEKNLTPAQEYSAYVVGKFCEKEDSFLVSKEALSQESVYIEAYSKEHPNKKILDSIEQWSKESASGVMLIHGEPGHGKTTLCRKAVYDFYRDRFCKDNTNVFWFRLNPAYCDIITDRKFVLENAFCWGRTLNERRMIPLDTYENEYKNSILFLDGYDELKVQAQSINIRLSDFIDNAKEYAKVYQMHLVITARTRSIKDELGGLEIPTLQFAPMTEQQQRKWIHARTELQSYEPAFEKLRNSSKEMKELLGIPILFRMVVQAQLENTTANNVVELYDRLFETTMQRRRINSKSIENWHKDYERLAYEIDCNDETFADMRNVELPEDFLYMFHLKGEGEQHVEFLHRSFYQYFLAYFLYHKMAAVKDEPSAEDFLCCLAERRIDKDVLEYIRQIQVNQEREKRQEITKEICEQIIDVLEQTGTIIVKALEVRNKNGNAEQHPLIRCENLFVNALSICCIVASASENKFRVSLREKEKIHQSMRRYDCSDIWLKGVDLREADLSDVNLFSANLGGADLSFTSLANADLRYAINLNTCKFENVRGWIDCKILNTDKDTLGLRDPDAHGIFWYNEGFMRIIDLSDD